MRKTEKLPDGTERERVIEDGAPDWAGVAFRGEAPPDRSGPLADEVLGTLGAVMPSPSSLPQEEGHPPTYDQDLSGADTPDPRS